MVLKTTRILMWLVAAIALAACQDSSSTDPGPGERISTLAASSQTTASTGVVSWEVYRDAVQTTVIGVDARGGSAFKQQMIESVVEGVKVLDVKISHPVTHQFRVSDGGDRVDVVVSDDPRLAALLGHLESDSKAYSVEDTEYGPCLTCATSGATCVASTAACASCPTNGLGCFACPVMVTSCFATGYYCACCYQGATNC